MVIAPERHSNRALVDDGLFVLIMSYSKYAAAALVHWLMLAALHAYVTAAANVTDVL